MLISNQVAVEKFTVAAGFNLYPEKFLETLTIQSGDTQVKLSREECEELIAVLDGKRHRIYAYEDSEGYEPHSVILCSVLGETRKTITLYTSEPISRF
jgi:hypothetical protein